MNPFSALLESESVAFVWVLVSVPSVVLLVSLFVTIYAFKQKSNGKLRKDETYEGIIQRLYENGESEATVKELARTREMVLFGTANK